MNKPNQTTTKQQQQQQQDIQQKSNSNDKINNEINKKKLKTKQNKTKQNKTKQNKLSHLLQGREDLECRPIFHRIAVELFYQLPNLCFSHSIISQQPSKKFRFAAHQ